MSANTLTYKGVLKGHSGWVTSIATAWPNSKLSNAPKVVATSSRDKSVIIWHVNPEASDSNEGQAGIARRSLKKHSQAVSDVVLSLFGDYCLSTSWDRTMRLWDVNTGESFRRFVGHESDIFSGAISADSRQIISCGRDKTIRLWNTLGEQKYKLDQNQHSDWISCVRFSPDTERALIVSCGWDRLAKVWDLQRGDLKYDFCGHSAPVNTVTVSPDGSLCATGSSDGWAMLWDVVEGTHLYSLEAGSPIHSLCFSPCNYWLCVATGQGIKVWDLENRKVLSDVRIAPETQSTVSINDHKKVINKKVCTLAQLDDHPSVAQDLPWITSLSFSPEGDYLYAGSSNGNVYVFSVRRA